MQKNKLREKGYDGRQKIPNSVVVGIMWLALSVILIILGTGGVFALAAALEITAESELNLVQEFTEMVYEFFDIMAVIVFFIVFMALYLALKCLATLLFCSEKDSISIKMLEKNAMPICSCREVFKVWQTVVIYFAPVFIMYSTVFLLNAFSAYSVGFVTWSINIILLSLFWAFDLTLIIYVLFIKIITRVNYISVDQHIYMLTLFDKIAETAKGVSEAAAELSEAKNNITDMKDEKKGSRAIPKAPGQFFLRVTGIFYIIAGGVSTISALIFWVIGHVPSDGYNPVYSAAIDAMPVWRLTAVNITLAYYINALTAFAAVIIGISVVLIGVTAVRHCDTLKHTKPILIFALVNLGIMAVGTIFLVSVFSVLGCAVAVLYFMGAFKNYREVYPKQYK